MFVNVAGANLHLVAGAIMAIDKAVPLTTPVTFDIDREARGVAADVGADEYFAAPATFALSASPAVTAGDTIEVSWTASGASAGDWIGLYAVGAADSASLERQSTAGQTTGTLFFTAPGTAGSYEMRYFSGNDVRVAVSNPIAVTAPPSTGDTTAPVVTLTSPTDGQPVSKMLSVTVAAGDNVGVTRVELYVDGGLAATSTMAPFTMKWNPRSVKPGAHLLQVKAFDAAGNSALSQVVTVYR